MISKAENHQLNHQEWCIMIFTCYWVWHIWAVSFPWTHTHTHKWNEIHTCSSVTLSSQRSRWCFLLRSSWPSAGRVPFPPTTSITLRQKQGGEQNTCSRGPLLKKKISLVLCSQGGCGYFQGTATVSTFVILTSHTLHSYCYATFMFQKVCFPSVAHLIRPRSVVIKKQKRGCWCDE